MEVRTDCAEQLEDLRLAREIAGVPVSEIVLPEDAYLRLDGLRFHYLDWGKPETQGPVILFVHGGGLTAHTWDLVCLALRSDFHCLAIDQRGHGDSDWSQEKDYSRAAYVRDLESFVDHLGLHRFVLVGMSLGGLNSLEFAGRHSARLAALVIVDVGPEVRVEGARRIVDFTTQDGELDSIEEFVKRAVSFNPRRDPRLLRRSLLHNLRQLPNGKWAWKYDARHRADWNIEIRVAEHRQLWQSVPKIACPTLVVRGAESNVFLDEDAKKLACAFPNGRWVRVPNAGHTVQGDNPKALVDEMRAFLTEISG